MKRSYAGRAALTALLLAAVFGGSLIAAPALAQFLEPPKLQVNIPTIDLSKYKVGPGEQAGTISIPFLAAYISGAYAYLIGIAGVVAGIMVVIGGFQYLTAGGDAGRVKAAKERITNAIAGVILTLSAYALLNLISPSFVDLKGLEITAVKGVPVLTASEITEFADIDSSAASGDAYCGSLADCTQKCNSGENPDTWGSTAAGEEIITIPDAPGLKGRGRLARKPVADGLTKAGALAKAQGYRIEVGSAMRSFKQQFDAICAMIAKGDTSTLGSSVAWPGTSLHEQGYAVDVSFVRESDGELLIMAANCAAQRAGAPGKLDSPEMSKILDQIMTAAGGRRYANEIWHYEFGGPTKPCRCSAGSCPAPPMACQGNC